MSEEKTTSFWIEVPKNVAVWNDEKRAENDNHDGGVQIGGWEIRIPEPYTHKKKRAAPIHYCQEEECEFWTRYIEQYRGHYALTHILGLQDKMENVR